LKKKDFGEGSEKRHNDISIYDLSEGNVPKGKGEARNAYAVLCAG